MGDVECLLNRTYTNTSGPTACQQQSDVSYINKLIYLTPLICRGTYEDYKQAFTCFSTWNGTTSFLRETCDLNSQLLNSSIGCDELTESVNCIKNQTKIVC